MGIFEIFFILDFTRYYRIEICRRGETKYLELLKLQFTRNYKSLLFLNNHEEKR